jgi:hypothetical protein
MPLRRLRRPEPPLRVSGNETYRELAVWQNFFTRFYTSENELSPHPAAPSCGILFSVALADRCIAKNLSTD